MHENQRRTIAPRAKRIVEPSKPFFAHHPMMVSRHERLPPGRRSERRHASADADTGSDRTTVGHVRGGLVAGYTDIVRALAVGYHDPDFPTNKMRIGREPVAKRVVFLDG